MKLPKLFKKQKTEKVKGGKTDIKKIARLVLPILIAFLFSLILVSKTDSFIFSFFVLISGFLIGYFLQSEYRKTDSNEKNIAITLYRMFIVRAGEKTDYRSAFEEVVENLPISDFKARTKDFIESGYSSDNPLTITKSRSEFLLINHIMHLVHTNEDYEYQSLLTIKKYLGEYESENLESEIEPVSVSKVIVFILFYFSIISLFLYES